MILTCPSCSTQYVVKDGAIPEGGRQVRCAACKHSWHQDPEPLELGEAETLGDNEIPAPQGENSFAASDEGYGEAAADAVGEEPPPEEPPGYAAVDPIAPPGDAFVEPASAAPYPAEEEERGFDEPPPRADSWQPPERDDEFSPFAERPVVEERGRSPARGLLVALLILALLGAAFWFLAPPEWKARVGLAEANPTPLQLVLTHSGRQAVGNGNELLEVAGRVINPTDERQSVPPIKAQLHSRSGDLVYSWTIAPPAPSLGPGESRPFNSAEVNVPAGGDDLTISLGNPRA